MKSGESMDSNQTTQAQDPNEWFTGDFAKDLEAVRHEMARHSDVYFREFQIGGIGLKAAIVFVEGLSDKNLIDKHIMKSLMSDYEECPKDRHRTNGNLSKEYILNKVLSIRKVDEARRIKEMTPKVLTGSTALMIEGLQDIFLLETSNGKSRNIEEPISEGLIRGPRAGFNENLCDNTALLRRDGENPSLSLIKFQVGKREKRDLVIAYMEDIAETKLVEEVKRRIRKIDIDSVPESGYVEQFIEDNYLSLFPQVQNTERPDRVIGALMEGRVAILLDGTPFVLIVPVTFSMLLQTPEDYYERWIPGTLFRLLRYFAVFVSFLAPALYISFISFHPGLIPTKLAISIIGTRGIVPFPAIIEALILEISIEILREAGLRLPKPVGPAMGIVGGLIIGEAAVQAGIVSQILVIVIAVTAISSFSIPHYSLGLTFRILRFIGMFCAAVFGLYGVILFFLLLCSHLVKLKSFGLPYASPAVPYRLSDWKDFMIRMPLLMMKRRPKMMHTRNPIRKG
ncbi:spore germination protein [Cohnella luojiensis]